MVYLQLALTGMMVILAIRGRTWSADRKWGITPIGYIVAALAIAVLVTSMIAVYQSKREVAQFQRVTYMEYVDLSQHETWESPIKIPSGTVIEFRGFECELELLRESADAVSIARSDEQPLTEVLVEIPGQDKGNYDWSIANKEDRRCDGVIFVHSTRKAK